MEENKVAGLPDMIGITEMISINVICRLCANQNDKLIGIYSEDGINNDLANKMNLYLPIKVNDMDDLPLQCCWQCASTLLAWHDLVITSVEADRRLRSYQFVTEKQLEEVRIKFNTQDENQENKSEEINPVHADLNAFCQKDPISFESDNNKIPKDIKITHTDLVPSNSDNLTELIDMGHSYLNLNEEVFEMKIEDKHGIPSAPPNSQAYPETEESSRDSEVKDEQLSAYNYCCQYCQEMFLGEEDIMLHIADAHPDKKPSLELKSEVNIKRERRKNNKIDQEMVNAAKMVVDGRIYYNCKQCNKCLHSPYTYVWHTRIHTGERPYVCDLCGKQFRVSQGLVRHLKETHARIKNFACDLCGRMFATRRNVEEHRRIHTNERPYICDLCGKSFKQKASLFVHNRSHTDSFPFRCSYCNQAFRTKPPLLLHVTKHTGEKPYPCDVCGRRFRIKYELKRHRLIHSDEKPFLCTTCGLGFKQKRYLRNHNKLNHSAQ